MIRPGDDEHDPGMISPRLANLGVRRDLTPEHARELGSLMRGRERGVIGAGLALNQRRQRALFKRWWNEVGELAGLVNRVRDYLNGDIAVAEDPAPLISDLLGSEYTRQHALELLEALDDAQLARVFADNAEVIGLFGARLRALLDHTIPPGHELRSRLENLFRDRFDDAGKVRTDVQLPLPFSPSMISGELADVGEAEELTPARRLAACRALDGRSDAEITGPLGPPPDD